MRTITTLHVRCAIFVAGAAFAAASILTGCHPTPTQEDLDSESAGQLLDSYHLPPDFVFVQGRKWPRSFVGSAGYAIRYSGPADRYKILRSAPIRENLGEFQEVACENASLPWDELDLGWLGLACPPDAMIRVARVPSRDAGDPVGMGDTALILSRNYSDTQLVVIAPGT
ncbi:hypothetical protein JVX90_17035 [Gordonia sp. PDNC005]|uniref:hypothetical protein n=1 Tax=unclassified Gordonia (in: high G+C Gram-positive bacteria) TaxID=2657482 RepID=UPI001965F80D|nr:hypothetical protein [Gordonia sp. PDNC005]QRY62081.1 hypothetical protein JVX90_17035 [Gordonia sp. PDNC005]